MEAKQRNVEAIVQRDRAQVERFASSIRALYEALNETKEAMQEFSLLAARNKAPNIITTSILRVSLRYKIVDNWS